MSVRVLKPVSAYHYEEDSIAPRLSDLDQKVLGIVDNSKANANLLLDNLVSLLRQKFTFTDILKITKPGGAVPASYTDEFFERCDFVINAFGD